MRIGFAAIGKGYAADKVRSLWKAAGVPAGIVNASGDLTAWGYCRSCDMREAFLRFKLTSLSPISQRKTPSMPLTMIFLSPDLHT